MANWYAEFRHFGIEAKMFDRLVDAGLSQMLETERSYRKNWSNSYRLWDRSALGDDLLELNVYANVLPAACAAIKSFKKPQIK